MSKQKPKIIFAALVAIVSFSLIAAALYQYSSSQEDSLTQPMPSQQETLSTMQSPVPSPTNLVEPIPSPIESASMSNTSSRPFPNLFIELSPKAGAANGSLHVT